VEFAHTVQGENVTGGHFFPEEEPGKALEALDRFFNTP
jgi:hypothetical protein